MSEIGEVTVIPKVEEYDIKWKIRDFLSISHEVGSLYNSPMFSLKGESCIFPPWSLWIFPNGNKYNYPEGSIYLCLCRRLSDLPVNAEFSFALKTVKGRKDLGQVCTKVFGKEDSPYTVQLISRSDFARRQSQFIASGALTVICTLKILKSTASESHSSNAGCSSSKRTLDINNFSSCKKKCMHKYMQCLECSTVINSENWYESKKASVKECSYCRENIDSKNISLHEKKCMGRTTPYIICGTCSELVLKQNWNKHECPNTEEEDETSASEYFKEMLLNGVNHDLIFKVGDKELKAHQVVLRTRSEVFKSMLSLDKKGKNSSVIDIHDCDPQAMEQFLHYIYTGKVDSLDQSNMLQLYYIANKYDMKGLIRKCSNFIRKSLSNTNICEVIQLVTSDSDSTLIEYATEYFKDNALDIMGSVEWKKFMKDNLTAANELMMKLFKKLENASA